MIRINVQDIYIEEAYIDCAIGYVRSSLQVRKIKLSLVRALQYVSLSISIQHLRAPGSRPHIQVLRIRIHSGSLLSCYLFSIVAFAKKLVLHRRILYTNLRIRITKEKGDHTFIAAMQNLASEICKQKMKLRN